MKVPTKKRKAIIAIAKQLQDNGFIVWWSKCSYYQEYLFFSIEGRLGYLELSPVGIKYATEHRSDPIKGTGDILGVEDAFSIEKAIETCQRNPYSEDPSDFEARKPHITKLVITEVAIDV